MTKLLSVTDVFSLKIIDKFIGRCLCTLYPRPLFEKCYNITKILIIRPGGIGDAILLAPAIISIKKVYPRVCITILAESRNAGVFQLVPEVNEVLCYDHPREFVRALLGRFDVVIDSEQWYRLSAVVARLVRAPMKIGFSTNVRRRMFTHGIRYYQGVYESNNFLTLLKPLGVNSLRSVGSDILELPVQSASKACQLLQPLGTDSFVVIFHGASIPEKRWGYERFSLVAKRLADDGYRIVVVGGCNDRAEGEVIAGGGGLNLAGLTNLAETAAVIDRSSLLISGDSGVLHLAAGLGIPTVSLFGLSSVTKWAPRGEKHIVINRQLSCSPCSLYGTTPLCPHDVRCMNEITADHVVEAAVRLLKKMQGKTVGPTASPKKNILQ